MKIIYRFGILLCAIAMTCVSCQKDESIAIDLLEVFDNTIIEYSAECSMITSMPFTKSGNTVSYDYLIKLSEGLPQMMKDDLDEILLNSSKCADLNELKKYLQDCITDINASPVINDNAKIAYVKGLCLYYTFINVAVEYDIKTKGVITQEERALIGEASKNDTVQSVVWGWVWGTITGGSTGGVLGAVGALLYELF